jgi:hypothetical protein
MNKINQVNFNFNIEQQQKFNEIYEETKRLYPHLVADDVAIQRVKVLIGHCILTNDAPLIANKKEDVILDLDAEN